MGLITCIMQPANTLSYTYTYEIPVDDVIMHFYCIKKESVANFQEIESI